MVDGGIKYIPMEISSHAIKMHRVDDVDVNIAVFANLSPDHLDFHGNMNNYFKTKLKLFENLRIKKILLRIEKLDVIKNTTSVGIELEKTRSNEY